MIKLSWLDWLVAIALVVILAALLVGVGMTLLGWPTVK
jgi:hypothetical protein